MPIHGDLLALGEVTQRSGKVVRAWAHEADIDTDALRSNTFEMEWPPRSGQQAEFPEIDRFQWFTPREARSKLNPAQAAFVDRLIAALEEGDP